MAARLLSLASTIGVAYATSAGATWEFNAFGNIISHACGVSTVRARGRGNIRESVD